MKEIKRLGSVNPNNEHQSGLVVSGGGCCPHSIQHNGETQSRQYGRLIVLGGIGDNERVNRDSKRVIDSKGIMYSLKAHISFEPPLVLREIR